MGVKCTNRCHTPGLNENYTQNKHNEQNLQNHQQEIEIARQFDHAVPCLQNDRQKVFGKLVQHQLGELRVCLIGCGGIGSIFAETLGRLGVSKWTLIDDDRLEDVNLNRMIGATKTMVEGSWYKVDYVKYLLDCIYPHNNQIITIPNKLKSDNLKEEIDNCDLIVVATDNHLFPHNLELELGSIDLLARLDKVSCQLEAKSGQLANSAALSLSFLSWCIT